MAFELHPALAAESLLIKELGVCNLYLRNVKHFPWLLLVPARENMREIFDLSHEDYIQAMDEYDEQKNHANQKLAVKLALEQGYILSYQLHKLLGIE